MFHEELLLRGWTLEADTLPESLTPELPDLGFSLPGASALSAFADLIGAQEDEQPETEEHPGVPFSLPAMLPEEIKGNAALSREIDFGLLSGDHAELLIDALCGSGSISLDGKTLLRFGAGVPCARIDLTDALRLCRKQTLSICFDDARRAGIPGTMLLRTTEKARFTSVALVSRSSRTFSASLSFYAGQPGIYAVRAAVAPSENEKPWGGSCIEISQAGTAQMALSFPLPASRFEAGKPYSPATLKLELYMLPGQTASRGMLCDVHTLAVGVPGAAPRAYIPLTKEECRFDPEALISRAGTLGVPALFLPAPASAQLYHRALLDGVALLPYTPDGAALPEYAACNPCVSPMRTPDLLAFAPLSPASACYQLCAMSGMAVSDPGMTDSELLLDAAGRRIHPDEEVTRRVLHELYTLSLRLRAEAARQGRYAGPLCAPGEWQDDSLGSTITAAFMPLHLSALPLRGAWWSGSRFSASLHAFIPETEQSGAYTAEAELTDAQGHVLAAFSKDCPACGGALGVIEAILPQAPCVLTLRSTLRRSGAIVETQELPVYVGLRGPLEAAFAE